MCQDIKAFEKLLDDFQKVYDPNKPVYEPSYLEICSYPGQRFEEISSRLIRFFIDVNGPHQFRTLFIDALFECYKSKYNDSLQSFGRTSNLIAKTEVKTSNGNRMDIVVYADDFIICIENKIGAPRGNPFDDYFNYIDSQKNGRKTYYILLSMEEDNNCVGPNGCFKPVFYREFIEILKLKLGDYLINCNRKYLSMLADWLQCLEKKGGLVSNISPAEREFFQKYDEKIATLIKRQSEFIDEKRKDDAIRIANIKNFLSANWEIYDGTDLLFKFMDGNPEYEIGIESWFENNGSYRIKITNWKKKIWEKYDGILKSHFTHILEENINGVRHNLFVKEMKNQPDEKIAEELENVWNVMNDIVNSVCKKCR